MTVQMKITSVAADAAAVLRRLGVQETLWTGGARPVRSPVSGEVMAHVVAGFNFSDEQLRTLSAAFEDLMSGIFSPLPIAIPGTGVLLNPVP